MCVYGGAFTILAHFRTTVLKHCNLVSTCAQALHLKYHNGQKHKLQIKAAGVQIPTLPRFTILGKSRGLCFLAVR